jgi:hypothetical protein
MQSQSQRAKDHTDAKLRQRERRKLVVALLHGSHDQQLQARSALGGQ